MSQYADRTLYFDSLFYSTAADTSDSSLYDKKFIIKNNSDFKNRILPSQKITLAKRAVDIDDKTSELNPDKLPDFIGSGYAIVKYYSPSCGACNLIKPYWIKVADSFISKNNNDIKFGNINCSAYPYECTGQNIESWPTIIAYYNGKKIDTLVGLQKDEPIFAFIKNYLDKILKDNNAPNLVNNNSILTESLIQSTENNNNFEDTNTETENVQIIDTDQDSKYKNSIHLNINSFDNTVKDDVWIIKFCNPDSPDCKELEPTWAKVSNNLASESKTANVHFGEVNCLDNIVCKNQGVEKFPVIRMYEKGLFTDEAYQHTEQEISVFVRNIIDKLQLRKEDSPTNLDNKVNGDNLNTIANPTYRETSRNHRSMKPLPSLQSDDIKTSELMKKVLIDRNYSYNGSYTELDSSNFVEYTSSLLWVINFFYPGCAECDSIENNMFKFRSYSSKIINVGYVDCKKNPTICEQQKITYFPTIKFLYNNYSLEYLRKVNSPDDISKFISEINFRADLIDTSYTIDGSNLKNSLDYNGYKLRKDELMFIHIGKSFRQTYSLYLGMSAILSLNGNFIHFANDNDLETNLYNAVSGKDPVSSALEIDESTLIAVKNGKFLKFNGNLMHVESVSSWMYEIRMSYYDDKLPEIKGEHFDDLLTNKDTSVLAILDPSNPKSSDIIAKSLQTSSADYKLFNTANQFYDKNVKFATIDGNAYSNLVKTRFNLRQVDLPAIVILDPIKNYYNVIYHSGSAKDESGKVSSVPNRLELYTMISHSQTLSESSELPKSSGLLKKTSMTSKFNLGNNDHFMFSLLLLAGIIIFITWRVKSKAKKPKVFIPLFKKI
ncbi:Thioredoxin domain-containing protein 5 [Smittium culicis]|uniref:Thioredoxin domain-containing protein 5 n=1 Tax=Smittium culicis TaxID=133412 RepID=A0A1R1XI12_9FUNG|nr:Thioredoxin domain-containing protein 5 [Smittium culicis]